MFGFQERKQSTYSLQPFYHVKTPTELRVTDGTKKFKETNWLWAASEW